jgi:hypothetical protein
MASNVLAMSLKMRNKTATAMNNLRKNTTEAGKAAQSLGTKFGKSIKASRTNVAALIGSMLNLKAIIIATFAYKTVQRFIKFLGDVIKHTETQRLAMYRLGETMASFGNYTKESHTQLVNLSNALQTQQAIADDVTLTNMSLLASYGMEADEIEKLMPLLHDFAKAKNIDTKTAVDLAGKAYVGYTGTLSRYGIILDSTLSKEEKYAEFMKLLNHYKGTAAKLSNTYAGEVERLKMAYGDMKEPMGQFLEDAVEQSGIMGTIKEGIINFSRMAEQYGPSIGRALGNALGYIGGMLKYLGNALQNEGVLRGLITIYELFKGIFHFARVGISYITAGIGQMSAALGLFIAKGNQFWQWVFGSKEEYEEAKKLSDELAKDFWDRVEEDGRRLRKIRWESNEAIAKSAQNITRMFSVGGFKEYMAEVKAASAELAKSVNEDTESQHKNRHKLNESFEKTLQLTKSMAQQFSLASRLEQEQTKYLAGRLSGMTAEDIGTLSTKEKELISKQSLLKAGFQDLFLGYAEKTTGIQAKKPEQKVKLDIGLTEEASKLVTVNGDKPVMDSDINNAQWENVFVGGM